MAFKPTSGLGSSLRRTVTAAAAPPRIGVPPPNVVPPQAPPPQMPVKQDDAFLHMMIEHNKRGVKIAQVQVANGKRPAVTKVAQSVILQHNAEIDRLKRLRGK